MILSTLVLLAATWSSHGPNGGRAAAVASAPSNPKIIYAGNSAGVLRSDDGGATWRVTAGDIDNVTLLAVDPVDPDTVFAVETYGEYSGEVYKTTDGGATWTDVELPHGISPVGLLVDPENRNTVYVGSECQPYWVKGPRTEFHEAAGVFKSTDGGATWEVTKRDGFVVCVTGMTLDPASPAHLIASTYLSTAVQSFDRGETWTNIEHPVPTVRIVPHPTDPNIRYGITNRNGFQPTFLTSTDAGVTWTKIDVIGVTATTGYFSLDIDRSTGRLFLGTDQGMFRSGDGGRSWLPLPVPQTLVSGIAVDPSTRSVVAGTTFGLFAAGFPYATAQPLATLDASASVVRVIVQPGDPRRLFAATSEVFTGTHWDGRIFRSLNGGLSWDAIPNATAEGRNLIAADTSGVLIVARYGQKVVYRLPRDGNAFELIDKEFPLWIEDIVSDSAGAIYVLTQQMLYRTRDGGLTWEELYAAGRSMSISPSHPDIIYIANWHLILWTHNGGLTWQQTEDESLDGVVVPAPSNASVVYGVFRTGEDGYWHHRIGRSDDDGRHFAGKGVPSENARIGAIAVDPHDWRKVWVTTQDGLFLSTDAGVTFQDANGNLPTHSIRWITIDDTTIHLGTDQGVWSSRAVSKRRSVR